MEAPADPLTCVRRWVQAGAPEVDLQGQTISILNHRFSRDEPTAFRKYNAEDEYYTLVEVLFFAMNRDKATSEYAREALARQIGRVSYLDHEQMKAYLSGSIQSCPQVDERKMAEYRAGSAHEQRLDDSKAAASFAAAAAAAKAQLSEEQLASKREHAQRMDEYIEAARKGLPMGATGYMEYKLDPQLVQADRSVLAHWRAAEVPLLTRATAMHRPGANLAEETLRWYQESVKSKPPAGGATAAAAAPGGQAAATAQSSSAKRVRDSVQAAARPPAKRRPAGPPIIIVPNSLTGVISSVNARELLEEARWVSIAAKKQQGGKREPRFQISRTVGGKTRMYEVVDDGKRLSESEWERVVAVFVSGEQWQFKDWKWSEPVELFQHVLGLHAMFDADPIRPTVASWNVRVVKLSNTRRHLDSTAHSDIWREIDSWMDRNARHLLAADSTSQAK